MTKGRQAFTILLVPILVTASLTPAAETLPKVNVPSARTPQESLQTIEVHSDLTLELVAAEPHVMDPIAIAWGPDGKLWVVEMGDYPLGLDNRGKPGGRVRFLEDTDADGRYDQSTLFLEQLEFPTGIMPWRKGVLVICAPDIFYAQDTDGDGHADHREVLYTGFGEGNPQHRVNGLRWGLDNWVYIANGDAGGGLPNMVTSLKTGKRCQLGSRDLRIRPDTGDLDPQSGPTQFGLNRDDWNNWFGTNNFQPMYHFVLPDHYLRRNPYVTAPDPRVHVSAIPGAGRLYPISRQFGIRQRAPRAVGQPSYFLGACSAMVYRDNLLGNNFVNNVFICDPTNNLVHRQVLSRRGVSFTSQRAAEEATSEFFASRDGWCRPVMSRTGPDGALWIVDMYRPVIEHPEWIPRGVLSQIDVRAGHERGRIYRVYRREQPPRQIPRLDRLNTTELVAALESPSGWQRDMAHQMLVQRHDANALPLLKKLVQSKAVANVRLQAACVLDGMQASSPSIVRDLLEDPHPELRRHGVRLSERFLLVLQGSSPELGIDLLQMADDPEPAVGLQLALTLGEWEDSRVPSTLAELALKHPSQPYIVAAVQSSVRPNNLDQVLTLALEKMSDTSPVELIAQLTGMAAALGDPVLVSQAIKRITTVNRGPIAAWQLIALNRILDSVQRHTDRNSDFLRREDAELLQHAFTVARNTVQRDHAPLEIRIGCIGLLGHSAQIHPPDAEALGALLVPQIPDEMQQAAVESLSQLADNAVAELLLADWKSHGPVLRNRIIDVLISRTSWAQALLQKIEMGGVLRSEIDATRRQNLLTHPDDQLRAAAGRILAEQIDANRQKVIERYRSALTAAGNADQGATVFAKQCAVCHRFKKVGQPIGPGTAAIVSKSPEELLTAMLDPNRAVTPRYVMYLAYMENGRTVTGILTGETANTITLTDLQGKRHELLRTEVEELASSGRSLMPEGLEKDLSIQDVSDLLRYLRLE